MPVDPLPFVEDVVPQYAVAITQLVYFVASFVAVYLLGRVFVRPLFDRVLRNRDLDAHARRPLKKIVSLAIVFAAISMAFSFAGYGNLLTSLATIAAAATLAIGFAMQDVLSNFVAGIFIYADEPFRIDDWIEWDDHSGIVEDISLRVTRVRTFDNELLTVPNSQLTDGVIKNPVAKEQLRQQFLFGIGYGDDIDEATEIIVEEAETHDDILDDPPVSVRLTELGDSYVGLKSRFWIANPSRSDFVKTRSTYVQRVKERFDEAGIDIPYPIRTLDGEVELSGSTGAGQLGGSSGVEQLETGSAGLRGPPPVTPLTSPCRSRTVDSARRTASTPGHAAERRPGRSSRSSAPGRIPVRSSSGGRARSPLLDCERLQFVAQHRPVARRSVGLGDDDGPHDGVRAVQFDAAGSDDSAVRAPDEELPRTRLEAVVREVAGRQ